MQSEPQDTDSDGDVYQRFHVPSSEDLGQGMRTPFPEAPTPTYLEPSMPHSSRDAYPAWTPENNSPLSKEEIEDIFLDLTQKFGFQRDSMRNMASLFIYPDVGDRCCWFYSCTASCVVVHRPWSLWRFSYTDYRFRSSTFLCSSLIVAHLECRPIMLLYRCMPTTSVDTMLIIESGTLLRSLILTTQSVKHKTLAFTD